MVKTITALFVLLAVLISVPASAQTLGLETKLKSTGTVYVGEVYAEQVSDGAQTGLFFWGLAESDHFAEIYIGPTWYPRKWFEVQIGAGAENTAKFWRLGGGAYLIDHGGSGLFLWEEGASGFWYKATYSHPVSRKISVGVFSRRFAGTGPLIEVKASKIYSVWATAGPDLQDRNCFKVVIGLNITAK